MASKKKYVKKAEKAVRKMGAGFTVLLVLLFAIGAAIGVGISYFLMKEDRFELNGSKAVTVAVGGEYVESGATVVAFGKDFSDKVEIEFYDSVGNKLSAIDTSAEGKYQLVYRVEGSFKWNGYQLIRIVTIGGENG